MPRSARATSAAAVMTALLAFLLYRATLLPDLELGDSSSFQVMGGADVLTPRDGYPLYYAISKAFVPFFGSRAHAMNLLSAVEAAAACGLILLVAVELSGSLAAAAAATLLFGGSYTFWSQAVIAEVYGLHILLVALTLLLLLRWSRRPTLGRLAWFFAAYALSFGHHLSMILLAPAYTLFLLTAAPGGWRAMVTPRVAALATALAALGALQYAWNFQGLWRFTLPPVGAWNAFQAFWFDVTKADWRDTMVLQVSPVMAGARALMYAFDLLQQFGWIGPVLAAAGLVELARTDRRRASLLALLFAVTLAFALGYNVGDAHVFFLPSHLIVALLAGVGVAGIDRRMRATGVAPLVVMAAAAMHLYRDYPALDRSGDDRPTALLSAMTSGLDDRRAVFLTDLNWQVQNGLSYFGDRIRPGMAYARLAEVLLYAPALIRDNHAIGRDVVVTERARQQLAAAYGPLFRITPDARVAVPSLSETIGDLPRGTRYVLCVLKPTREFLLDRDELDRSIAVLAGGHAALGGGEYAVLAGLVGERPALTHVADRPFRRRVTLDGLSVDVRMESWLAFDTIRRMGFGHVIANREHALIVERGLSFVALAGDGRAMTTAYAAGIFAPQPRYLVLSSN
jgi:hypothetical protein